MTDEAQVVLGIPGPLYDLGRKPGYGREGTSSAEVRGLLEQWTRGARQPKRKSQQKGRTSLQ